MRPRDNTCVTGWPVEPEQDFPVCFTWWRLGDCRPPHPYSRARATLRTADGLALEAKLSLPPAASPVFSPDSQRVAYVAKRGGKNMPVYGSFEGNGYDEILTCPSALEERSQSRRTRF